MTYLGYDYVIIGSGFGGAVSAFRLSEKGYKVLVIEKGKWYKENDFPKTNWNLKKWMWLPKLGFHGIFKMTFLNHVTALSGVGVGGGSLTYANTLPVPKEDFFKTGSWAHLNIWQEVLAPFYTIAYKMLGAAVNPILHDADHLIKEIAEEVGKGKDFKAAKVGVFFGEPGKTVKDPYFNGKGPDRKGCIHCGACMTGCRYNAKNTLDKNYLYLAQQLGAEIIAEKEVFNVAPLDKNDSSKGYKVSYKSSIGKINNESITAKGVVFSGGVMGTIPLLLKLKMTSLPKLSDFLGKDVRTNNESLLSITSREDTGKDFSKGLSIGSILHTDKNSHLEPVRYSKGSSFIKMMTIPTVKGRYGIFRILGVVGILITKPFYVLQTFFTRKYAEKTTILLFMQTLDSTLQLKKGRFTQMKTIATAGQRPNAFIPEALGFAKIVADKLKGIPYSNFTDVLLGTTTTAHILGGAVMGENRDSGVIDKNCKVFGYQNMMICDGSIISANPGVNPSLSITAISEYAMDKIPKKERNIP